MARRAPHGCVDRLQIASDGLAIRIDNAAGEIVTVSTELVNVYEPPAAELEPPRVRALTEMARVLAALDNDLHSHPKTVALHETHRYNLLTVIAARHACGPDEAIARAVRLRDRIMCRFLLAGTQTSALSTDTGAVDHCVLSAISAAPLR
ncbi:terpene synthase family protein [Nocardia sp. NPDC002869]|uniref:terpene synthase family protein n=1 Tax=Nocardia sp. NPDC002869 TaxID=3161032 RepID=UPI00398C9CC3